MIDDIDHQIITILQQDARISNTTLAEKIGSTSSTVYERIRKLERKGIIKRYVAIVDHEALGKQITAFIRLSVGSAASNYIDSKHTVMEIASAEPEILECHGVAGADCYVLKVRVENPKALETLIEKIRSRANIASSVTSIVLSTFKEDSLVLPADRA